jgi:hypothetical protein
VAQASRTQSDTPATSELHVTNVRPSGSWYARPRLSADHGVRRGHLARRLRAQPPYGGSLLTLRLDPEQARKTAGWV